MQENLVVLWGGPTFWSGVRNQEIRAQSQNENPLQLLFIENYDNSGDMNTIVVCCCKLKNTRDCDEHLFGQVITCTGRYQLPIFRCTNVHP